MDDLAWLPTLSPILNLTTTTLLVLGIWRIKRKDVEGRRDVEGHRRLMTAAMWTSAAFLAAYLVNHAIHGVHGCGATGAARVFYFVVLDTHTPLAIAVAYMAPRTAWLGSKGRLVEHRRLAKWTFPIWLYVSITGVMVYVMAYHLWPPLVKGS